MFKKVKSVLNRKEKRIAKLESEVKYLKIKLDKLEKNEQPVVARRATKLDEKNYKYL